jgi:hypothetical protein
MMIWAIGLLYYSFLRDYIIRVKFSRAIAVIRVIKVTRVIFIWTIRIIMYKRIRYTEF